MPGRLRIGLAAFLCITAAAAIMLPSGADAAHALPPAAGTTRMAGGSACASPEARTALLRTVLQKLRSLRADIASFWLQHGVDSQFGGFHATVDRGGVIGKPTDKGLVQQARHVWFFSHAVAARALNPSEAAAAEAAAKDTWAFMRDHMAANGPNGIINWRWLVSRDGSKVVQAGPHLYGQFFAIYAAVEYYKTFKDPAALAAALSTFRAIDTTHDSAHGGFDETSSRPRLSNDTLQGGGVPRTLNIFLHGTESLAALFEATGDTTVRDRLVELVTLLATRMVTNDGVMYEFYDPVTWKPSGPPSVNWGHNLESAWLVAVTCDLLKQKGALPAATADAYTARLMTVAARAAREGYDSAHGGFYEAGVPGAAPGEGNGATTDKLWWVQCESSLALWQLWLRTGDCTYLDKLAGTVEFIRTHLRDPQDGEWLWSTDLTGTHPAYRGHNKGNIWKASYHNGRMLTFLDEWISAAIAGGDKGTGRTAVLPPPAAAALVGSSSSSGAAAVARAARAVAADHGTAAAAAKGSGSGNGAKQG